MNRSSTILRYVAFALMTLAGLLGGLFAAGSAFADLDRPQAIGTTAPWLVLAIALSAFAYWSRRIAPWAFVLLTVFMAVRSPVESALGLADRDDPFSTIAVLVLAVALAFLGLHRALLAGALLWVLGAGQLVAVLVNADRDDATFGELLTTSSGAVVLPILVVGAIFLAAGSLDRKHPVVPPVGLEPTLGRF